jgi:hypothetical protein
VKHSAHKLTSDNYSTACDLAGAALLRRIPGAATILAITEDEVWSDFSTGIYIAADYENTIRYVGSAVRAGRSGVGDRIQEHVLSGRAAHWARLMVVPLTPSTDEVLVRRIEGRIGAVLRPLDAIRLPSTRRPPRNRSLR